MSALFFNPYVYSSSSGFTFTFTNIGATGSNGPTTLSGYSSGYPSGLTLSNGIQYWPVPTTGTYSFVLAGAGSSVNGTNANGWVFDSGNVNNRYTLNAGTIVAILVGQQGTTYSSVTTGGSGCTYVATVSAAGSLTGSVLLFAAGGGGGIGNTPYPNINAVGTTSGLATQDTGAARSLPGSNGNGASGWLNFTTTCPGGGGYLNGNNQGTSPASVIAGYGFLQGGAGGVGTYASGGFGGGTASNQITGGGGGGYSGGAGGGSANGGESGGAGGSYNINTSLNTATGSATNTGMGYVIVTKI